MTKRLTDEQLDLAFLDRTCPEPNSGCVLWTGSVNQKGYGLFTARRKGWVASRFAWTRANGPVPTGMLVCHTCDTPSCVNVGHLFLGTNSDNARDKVQKGRAPRGEESSRSKLTEDRVRTILSSRAGCRELAKLFGVHRRTIRMVRRRRTWAHVSI